MSKTKERVIDPKARAFHQYILDNWVVSAYEKLPEKLGISRCKFTRILNNPAEATYDQLLAFSHELGIPAIQLWRIYGLGDITAKQLEELQKQTDELA